MLGAIKLAALAFVVALAAPALAGQGDEIAETWPLAFTVRAEGIEQARALAIDHAREEAATLMTFGLRSTLSGTEPTRYDLGPMRVTRGPTPGTFGVRVGIRLSRPPVTEEEKDAAAARHFRAAARELIPLRDAPPGSVRVDVRGFFGDREAADVVVRDGRSVVRGRLIRHPDGSWEATQLRVAKQRGAWLPGARRWDGGRRIGSPAPRPVTQVSARRVR